MLPVLAIGWPGPFEMILLAGLGLLLFGKRLPEVGRSLGKGIVEFKRGLKDVENEISQSENASSQQPKLDPYAGKSLNAGAQAPQGESK